MLLHEIIGERTIYRQRRRRVRDNDCQRSLLRTYLGLWHGQNQLVKRVKILVETVQFLPLEFYPGIPGKFSASKGIGDRMRCEVFPITHSQLAIELGVPGNGNGENLISDLGLFGGNVTR